MVTPVVGGGPIDLAVEVHGLGGRFAFEDVELVGEFVEGGVNGCGVGGAVIELHAESVEVFMAGNGLVASHESEPGGREIGDVAGEAREVPGSVQDVVVRRDVVLGGIGPLVSTVV